MGDFLSRQQGGGVLMLPGKPNRFYLSPQLPLPPLLYYTNTMSLPIVKYESAYHARSLPFIGDAGSIDFSAKERGLPKSEIFITSDLTQAVAGQGFAVSAVRGKDCQKMVDEDCGVVVDSIVKARNR